MSTPERKPIVLFYVQHLLGIGHVFRATRVARALARQGCRVHMAWGGMPIPDMDLEGLDMTWLEPVKVEDEDFKTLLLSDGTPISEAGKEARKAELLALFEKARPDIVITEAYPFGRRQMRFELLPLMEAAKDAPWKPITITSIRDIMQENRAEKRVRESIELVGRYFDHVMVHGDPNLIRIEDTLQGSAAFSKKVFYTGLVTPEQPNTDDPNFDKLPKPAVLISAGGGAVGLELMRAAIKAMPLSKTCPQDWLMTTGPDLPVGRFAELVQNAPKGMRVVRFIPKLANVMARAEVSVSRAGYNTVGDLLRAGSKAVLVPFEGGLETEQYRRAMVLDRMGAAVMLRDDQLNPQSLADAVDHAYEMQPPRTHLDLDGAANAATLMVDLFERRSVSTD